MNVKITTRREKRLYRKIYNEPVKQAVLAIWDFFYRLCGKRLVPMIRENLKALAVKFNLLPEVQAKLIKVSRSTVERMLGRERKQHKTRGTSATKPWTLLK
jgi:hypothetical protein